MFNLILFDSTIYFNNETVIICCFFRHDGAHKMITILVSLINTNYRSVFVAFYYYKKGISKFH